MPTIHVRSEAEYETVLTKNVDKLIIVDFTAQWCGPCQKVAPFYEKLSDKYRQCVFLKVDVDDNQEIAMANNVSAMPTFLLIKKKKEVDRLLGIDVMALEEKIQKLGGPPGSATSFDGEGHRLGGPGTPTTASNANIAATTITDNLALENVQKAMNVDEAKPVAKVNVRLTDGSRFTVTLNLSQPVSRVRDFICALRPDQAGKTFVLMTTFPNQEVGDENISIEKAKVANAVLVQKLK